jgi:hypothetical protein
MMDTVRTSETSVYFDETPRRYIPESYYFQVHLTCRAMAQAVSRLPLTTEARVRCLVSLCWICDGQCGTGTGFSPRPSVFPCQYSTVALHTHISVVRWTVGPAEVAVQRHSLTQSKSIDQSINQSINRLTLCIKFLRNLYRSVYYKIFMKGIR